MLFPLVVLAGLSIVGGVIQLPTYAFIPENWQQARALAASRRRGR